MHYNVFKPEIEPSKSLRIIPRANYADNVPSKEVVPTNGCYLLENAEMTETQGGIVLAFGEKINYKKGLIVAIPEFVPHEGMPSTNPQFGRTGKKEIAIFNGFDALEIELEGKKYYLIHENGIRAVIVEDFPRDNTSRDNTSTN